MGVGACAEQLFESVLQCGEVCCSLLQVGMGLGSCVEQRFDIVLQCVDAVICSVLQCSAVCCSVLQYTAVFFAFCLGGAAVCQCVTEC